LSCLVSTKFDLLKGPASAPETAPHAARFLEGALLFTFVAHLLGMLSMLFLLPGLPGGPNALLNARSLYVAQHPWIWRLGWFPWQLTALSDLLLSLALWRTTWIKKFPAACALVATISGIIPDQVGQALWISHGARLAQNAVASGDFTAYANFEASTFRLIAVFGTIGYLLGALAWTWCFASAGTWSRRLSWLSWPLWSFFALATVCIYLPESWQPAPMFVSVGNALAFVLLMFWFVLVAERVWARSRPQTATGRYAHWRHPNRSIFGKLCDSIANSHLLRAFGERLAVFSLLSDATDVVYINFLVEASRLLPLVPRGLELQRLGPQNDYALFTCLTYRHGHLGPSSLGPFRRLLPSPIQSNWRIYVNLPNRCDGIYFVSTCINSTPHALTARLLAEGLPMHVSQVAKLGRAADDSISINLDPGAGTGPDLRATLKPSADKTLPTQWQACFTDYANFLSYCVPQDRALSCQLFYNRLTRQEISLGIPLESCISLTGQVSSKTLERLVGKVEPVCFLVPRVKFHLSAEIYETLHG
jgi:hypothetical protein